MNVQENGANDPCFILTNSSANLNLNSGDTILKAYLYWAGSGSGDFQIKIKYCKICSAKEHHNKLVHKSFLVADVTC
jgi:hypothetical protein